MPNSTRTRAASYGPITAQYTTPAIVGDTSHRP
jgi:hypothetical protein